MGLREILGDIMSLIKNDDVCKYFLKGWIYKEKCCVLDFHIDEVYFAYDLYYNDGLICVDFIDRSKGKNKNISTGVIGDNDDIYEIIKNNLVELVNSILDSYQCKISIIIPVYNRGGLIEACVKSLNTQTSDKSDFEVLFVDDFSSDNSIESIDRLVQTDLNYRILKRPINSGAASAPRNDGIKAAKGRYVFFVDSDDYIFDYTIQDLIEMSYKNNSDMVYVKFDGDKGRPWGKRPFAKGDVDVSSIAKNHLVRSLMAPKLIKRSLLIRNNIYYPVDIKVGEDRVFMMQVISKAKTISILGSKPYYYITNHDQGRLTHAPQNLEQDFYIVSRIFKSIYMADKSENDKKAFFSSWMNVVLESYVTNRAKSKKSPIAFRQQYINYLVREFSFYSDLHSDEYIYPEFKELYKIFSLGNVDDIVTYCLKS